jgi:hypothetical protein
MARIGARRYLRAMQHHHIALSVAIWVNSFASTLGACIVIFAGIWSAKHPGASRGFDFAASARRIRAMPIPARDDA